jgi:gamma-glutamylputrescine oxidase
MTVWDDRAADGLGPLDGDARADVCVVGLGVAGLTAAATVAAHGRSVVGVEAGAVGAGASGRNGGFLLAGLADFHHVAAETLGPEAATAWYRVTLGELDRAESLAPGAVRRTGSVRIAVDDDELDDCSRQLEAMRRDGLPVEPYDGPSGVGLRFPHDAAAHPLNRLRALARHAAEAGARLHDHTAASVIAGDRVETGTGTIACGHTIVCVDGGLDRVLTEAAALGVRTARAQMLATGPEPRRVAEEPVYARWGYDYWQQLPDGRVALGGGRDLGGDAEWTDEQRTTPAVQGALDRLLRGRLRVEAPVTHRWDGLTAFGPGPLPVLADVRPGVTAVGGYRGTGAVLAALYGRAAAERAVTGQSSLDALLGST